MNPLLWLLFMTIFWIFCNFKKIKEAILERRHILDCLEKIPGPYAFPLIGIAYKLSADSVITTYIMEYFFRSHTDAKDSPGILKLWLGPKPIVCLYRPETIKPIMESHILVQKPNDYDYLKDWLGEGLLTSSNPKWQTRRKMLTPAFHFNILENFMHVFNEQADILIEKFDKEAAAGYPVDIYPSLKALALDVICEAAMGAKMGSQSGKNMEYVKSVKVICELLWMRIRSPWLWPKFMWYVTGNGPKFQKAFKVVTGFTQRVIAERKKERLETMSNNNVPDKKPAFLDILLNMQEEKGLTDEDIREEVDTFMFEGHDTVSNTISFFLFLLTDQRQLPFQDKIYEELTQIFADDPDREVITKDLGKMKYLEQCIKEGMRMVPVVPMVGRIALHDIEIEGYTVPKGVAVMVTPFLVHRNRHFWKEPNEFEPTHFDAEETKARHPFAYVPFSAGARNCIGQKFAMNQMKVVLSKILRRYKFVGHVHEVENRGLPELVMKMNDGCVVRVEMRDNYVR